MRLSKSTRGLAALLLAAAAASASAQAADPAVFDPATGTLQMPVLQLDNSAKYRNVVVRLLDLGRVQINDGSVGQGIQFLTQGGVLRLPQVRIGDQVFSQVTLANPGFVLVSLGDLVIDSGAGGNYQLDIQVQIEGLPTGTAVPPITVANVPKPSTEAEFCGDPALRNQITQSAQGFTGTWTVLSCSFNGTSGSIAMQLNVSGFMNLRYTATYTYR